MSKISTLKEKWAYLLAKLTDQFADGDELKMMLMGLKRFTKHEAFNPKEARQRIAIKLIEKNEYCF